MPILTRCRHEMRNPLSAIMLSADGIANSIIDFRSPLENAASAYRELLENNLDAAQTIVLCAQHQKRIIDDVLTLSKLNSALLQVTPVSVQVCRSSVLKLRKQKTDSTRNLGESANYAHRSRTQFVEP